MSDIEKVKQKIKDGKILSASEDEILLDEITKKMNKNDMYRLLSHIQLNISMMATRAKKNGKIYDFEITDQNKMMTQAYLQVMAGESPWLGW